MDLFSIVIVIDVGNAATPIFLDGTITLQQMFSSKREKSALETALLPKDNDAKGVNTIAKVVLSSDK